MTDDIKFESTDSQGLTVWQRLDACDRAILHLTAQVTELQQRYGELLKRLSRDPAPKDVKFRPAPFGSINNLVEQIERMFDCKDGDHRAVHMVSIVKGEVQQYPYTTVGLIAPADIPDAQERLRQAMYTSFHKLKLTCKSERPVLYWRYGQIERVQEDTEIYARGTSFERAEKYKIMTRIAIPEADFSVVADVLKADDGLYATLFVP